MKDYPIGKIFTHPEYGKLKVVAEVDVNGCYGCVFNSPKVCMNDADKRHTGACAIEYRSDGQGVIFVKAEGGENA